MAENEMVGWHHQLNGHEFEQTLGDDEGQESLLCCSPWVAKSQTRLSHWRSLLFSLQFSSVQSLSPTLCDPVNRSMPGLPVHHQLPEFTQTHVHQVCDAIQPLLLPSPPAPNLSHHQSLFQ